MTWAVRYIAVLLLSAVSFEVCGASVDGHKDKQEGTTEHGATHGDVHVVPKENIHQPHSDSTLAVVSAGRSDLSAEQRDILYSSLEHALSGNFVTPEQKQAILHAALSAAIKIRDIESNKINLVCPHFNEILRDPLVEEIMGGSIHDIRKLTASKKGTSSKKSSAPLDSSSHQQTPGVRHLSNLLEKYNGLLKPRDEMALDIVQRGRGEILGKKMNANKTALEDETPEDAQIGSEMRKSFNTANRKGNIYLFDTAFNIAGFPIGPFVKQLKFVADDKGKTKTWDQVPPFKTSAMGKMLTACKNPRNCQDWDTFKNYLKQCPLGGLEEKGCIAAAVNSPVITQSLSEYWDHVGAHLPEVSANDNTNTTIPDEQWDIHRFKKRINPKQDFIDEPSVRSNALWLRVLRELVERDAYYSTKFQLKGDFLKNVITKMLEDSAFYLSKLQEEITLSKSQGVGNLGIKAALDASMGGVASQARKILVALMTEDVKGIKGEEADEAKQDKAVAGKKVAPPTVTDTKTHVKTEHD